MGELTNLKIVAKLLQKKFPEVEYGGNFCINKLINYFEEIAPDNIFVVSYADDTLFKLFVKI